MSAQIFKDINNEDVVNHIKNMMKHYIINNTIDWNSYKNWMEQTIYNEKVNLPISKKKKILNGLLLRTKTLYYKFNKT